MRTRSKATPLSQSRGGFAANEAVAEEVRSLIESIGRGDYARASEVVELGRRERCSTGPRGTILVEAFARLTEQHLQDTLLAASRKVADETARVGLIIALGEWGDHHIIAPLLEEFSRTSCNNIRGAIVLAIGSIGGPICVQKLVDIVSDHQAMDALRLTALNSLEGLAIHAAQTTDTRDAILSCSVKEALRCLESDALTPSLLRTRASLFLENVEATTEVVSH